MSIQEPKVEFVPIDQNVLTTAAPSGCPDSTTQEYGGGQRCIASQVDATTCADFESQIPW